MFRKTKYIIMLTKEGSIKIVNFITLGTGVLVLGHGHISHIVTKIVNFMTHGAGVLMLGLGHMSYSEMRYPLKIVFFTPRHR